MEVINLIGVKLGSLGFYIKIYGLFNYGHMLADVPAVLGSLDIVFGEVDR